MIQAITYQNTETWREILLCFRRAQAVTLCYYFGDFMVQARQPRWLFWLYYAVFSWSSNTGKVMPGIVAG